MPISKYFGGHGASVMADMVTRHGADVGKRMFYATANKRHQNPDENKQKPATKRKPKSLAARMREMQH